MTVTLKPKESGPSELAVVLSALRKKYGEKSVVKGNTIPQARRIPTGVFEFDLATGGGFPRGRISLVYGPESSGKTNICYKAAAQAQRMAGPCNVVIWVDLEGTFDPIWAECFGVDTERLILIKPSFGEEAVDMIIATLYSMEVALVVIDSIAQMTPAKEIEGEAADHHPGRAAMLVKRLCNQAVIALSKEGMRDVPHDPALVLINQTRFKIGVMHGDPETIPGGNTMKFLSCLTVRLYGKNKVIKEISPEKPAAKETVAVIKKAKVGIVQTAFEYDMALINTPTLNIGDTDSWNTVMNHLKQLGALTKVVPGTGWSLFKEKFPTLVPIAERYRMDHTYRLKCQSLVVRAMQAEAKLVESTDAAQTIAYQK